MIQISNRMKEIGDMVSRGHKVADVGTDHGYIPIYLIAVGKCPAAIAMDVRPGPLSRAAEHIRRERLENYIECRLGDGTKKLEPGEADTLVIAGMGGALISRILSDTSQEVLDSIKEFVLQPQSELLMVREFLAKHGLRIEEERFLLEEGKYYTIIRAVHGQEHRLDEAQKRYGGLLLENRNPLLFTFLCDEHYKITMIIKKINNVKSKSTLFRLQELNEDLRINERAQEYYKRGSGI